MKHTFPSSTSIKGIVVPLLGQRIAPRLCFAGELLVTRPGVQGRAHQQRVRVGRWPDSHSMIEWIAHQQVDHILCCGVSQAVGLALKSQGVQVLSGLTGEARAVVAAFLAGTLDVDPSMLPEPAARVTTTD